MSKVTKIKDLLPIERDFASSYEALKKELKKAGTSIKKVLRDPNAEYHDDDNQLSNLAFAKTLYDMLDYQYNNKDGVLPVAITVNTVAMVNDLKDSMVVCYYTGKPYVPAQTEEEEEYEENEDEEYDEDEDEYNDEDEDRDFD